MRTLSLLLISMFLVTGCGAGGGSEGGTTSGSGNTVSDGGSNNGGSNNDGTNGGFEGGNDGASDGSSNDGSTPVPPPPPPPSDDFADQMLYAVNTARAQARDCGGQMMPAVDPLTWDYSLEQAAYVHSSDQANGGFMSHTGSDGSQPSDRVSAQGYNWASVGENVAAGQKDIDAVMTAWLNSAGHCKNIMSANYTQMGSASVSNSDTRYGIYWTQVFARPR
ncbi:CAP domain-containing protein [Photobacterium sp. SDRW27]|uniref:CAP domain-containing protein n=1 Tax=Photobacterium obscurum TaxID=2829490 RepID=UPI0022434B86|nr:CAP domain-containing protein [Photobacterium obscurum]MCW8329999.1 CAP domain-containing protein [Photobacterium obscurum]